MANPVEAWKAAKHGLDVWSDVERHAVAGTPMKQIDADDLERMKWYGFFYRKRDEPGRYMSRIRITANEMTAAQAKEIARLAYEFGHGIVDVTTRANVQVQGLSIEYLPEVRRRLEAVGLTAKQTGHDNIRNVFGHPFSGLLPEELIDTRELCRQVTALFVDSREYSDLPRKMNICMNGTSEHSAHFWTQDISYLATTIDSGEVLFRVLIGGTQGQNPHLAWHLPVLVAPHQVVDVTRSILDLFRAKGSREKRNAARFCFLMDEIGVEGVLSWLDEDLDVPLTPCHAPPPPSRAHDELIGWFAQTNSHKWTMGLSVPLGRMTWQQFEGLGVLAERWGDGQLRTTHEQGMAVVNISTSHKQAALTDAAALGLSIHADALDRNTMACTGSQFCNIAVTETKGQMFQLLEKLRKKQVRLEGIRIHMSGCPSSCAQHFTADIGLKGVRVRRLLGTREGFDVFLGGGIADGVQMGRTFRLGVDADQLPTLIEEVVTQYYLSHRPGQSFSAYWREQLPQNNSVKAEDEDFKPPIWVCEKCRHEHAGVDPPVFCPSCAGLRRYFARLDDAGEHNGSARAVEATAADVPARGDGFVFAAAESTVPEGEGLGIEIGGKELALFRAGGTVHAIDALCPHEGAPLAQGAIADGVVTCPWHGWTFNACSGCSIDPPNNDAGRYETLVEDGRVYVKTGAAQLAAATATVKPRRAEMPVEAQLRLTQIIDEAPEVRTFRFDNRAGLLALDHPGKFVKICVPGDSQQVWRSFTISSSPHQPDVIDLTVKLNPDGVVSRWLFENARTGDELKLRGPHGGFFFDHQRHTEPLVLVSAGSGVTPMMSIARWWRDRGLESECTFFHGARKTEDILFRAECEQLASVRTNFAYHVSLSRPDDSWQGLHGRLTPEVLLEHVGQPTACRYFLCGPNDFMDRLRDGLTAAGVPAERIHTEQFHASMPVKT
jgi:ferredoxin-nitrite reductase